MAQVAEALVGREAELELLDRLLDEACGGASRFAVLSGEPGIGKTSVLSELGRRAAERDCLVLEGRASELERELAPGRLVSCHWAEDIRDGLLRPKSAEQVAAVMGIDVRPTGAEILETDSLVQGIDQPIERT